MKIHRTTILKRGFTLMELMVAMAITTIIVTVLVSITSIAIDTWNRSRSELRASRQGKAMVDTMARDFESLVVRRGNEFEWLWALTPVGTLPGPNALPSSNACELIFLSGSTERYEGNIGSNDDKGGDVSCISYILDWKEPVKTSGSSKFETFVLKRMLLNPDATFKDILGKPDLESAFSKYKADLSDEGNFVCENVYQYTITFHVEVVRGTGENAQAQMVPITVGQTGGGSTVSAFRIKGTGIEANSTPNGITSEELKAARLKAIEISLTVITDSGIDQLRNRPFSNEQKKKEFLSKNSYQYSKLVQVASM